MRAYNSNELDILTRLAFEHSPAIARREQARAIGALARGAVAWLAGRFTAPSATIAGRHRGGAGDVCGAAR